MQLAPAGSIQVGDVHVFAIPDGAADLNGWPMAPELDGGRPVAWAEYAHGHPDGFHGADHRWRIHNTCYAVRSAGHIALVDCGVGAGPYPWYAGMRGRLPASLSAAGLEPGDIDTVFLTHAHPDHVGWAFAEDAHRPFFPSARYLLNGRDWDEFKGRVPVPRHFSRFIEPLERAGVLSLIGGELEIAPGLDAFETPGHTPGHMSLLVRSRGEGLVITGDVLNSPMYVTEPDRPFGSDQDREGATRTRIALVERIERDGWWLAAGHFPEPGFGTVVRLEGRRWFRALG